MQIAGYTPAQLSKGGTKVVFRKCVFAIYQLQFDLE